MQICSVSVDDEDFRLTTVVGLEGDLSPIWRPLRIVVTRGVIGELMQVGAVSVDYIDFAQVVLTRYKSNPAAQRGLRRNNTRCGLEPRSSRGRIATGGDHECYVAHHR